jgi:hypothetical protein
MQVKALLVGLMLILGTSAAWAINRWMSMRLTMTW